MSRSVMHKTEYFLNENADIYIYIYLSLSQLSLEPNIYINQSMIPQSSFYYVSGQTPSSDYMSTLDFNNLNCPYPNYNNSLD
jgi:hypothetical protein